MSAPRPLRLPAVFLCLALLAALSFPAAYVIENVGHPHSFGETEHTCPVCYQLRVAQAVLQTLSCVLPLSYGLSALTILLIPVFFAVFRDVRLPDPISSKTRMNC